MTSTAWTFTIPKERVQDFRGLLADLNKDLSGLAERARDVGYHRERMWLQPNRDESAEFIVYLEFDEGVDLATLTERLLAYDSEFTRWWRPRFESFGFPKSFGEPLLTWDAID
ncbi:hypothetical protein [Actinoalloteichus hymeniacidonis]|uniref:Uncharacterized protein n=1 Tax=Actinoalloteichus hymeniacidonis TaxID=340345 RepID=A0AAC9HRX4_9PSEU|nr:hypothetical protein [Actinoalloteichus hymeniacidonis]AOS64527.1 hypothetical protein TL08_18660 [Actinoalloteichus hymeniacidonis]MBB5907401.1 hypothetical protein [Actinoalloteichus hymeniacidonis]